MPEVADLFVTLRAITAPFTEALAKSGAEAARFAEQLKLMESSATKLGGRLTALGAEADKAGAGLKVAGTEAKAAGTSMEASSLKVEGLGGKLLGLGPVFDKVTKWGSIGLAGVGIASVDLGMKFQTEMTKLVTAAGAPASAIDGIRNKVLDLGTQTGYSGTQIAEALYHPISAGLDLASSLQVVKYSAQEARISGASLDDTTYSLSSVMKAFNQQASDAGPTMAQLNAIVGEGDMRFQDFNQSIKNWAPTAAQMGISIESMGAGLAYLTDRGNSAEVAATRMTMGLTMMTTPSAKATAMLEGLGLASSDVQASSAAMQDAMKTAGITQNQLALDLQKPDGLYVALHHLKQSLIDAGVSGTEADSVLSKIFGGGRSDKAILSLMQNLDGPGGLSEKYDKITAQASGDAFGQAWKKTSQTLSVQLKQIGAGIENAGIRLGMVLIPHVSSLLTLLEQRGAPVVKKFGDGLKGIVQGFTGNTNPDADHGKGQARGEAAPSLTGWQKAGEELKKFSDAAVKFAGDLRSFARDAKTALENLAKAAAPLAKDLGGVLLEALKTIGKILKDDVGPALVTVTQFMKDHKEAVKVLVEVALVPLLMRLAALAILKPIGIIASLARDIVMFPFGQLGQIWKDAKTAGSAMSDAFDTGRLRAMYAWDAIKSGALATKDVLVGAFDATKFQAQSLWSSVKDSASTAWSFVSDKASSLKSTLSSAFDSASFRAQYMWQGVKDGASTAWSWVADKSAAMKDALVSALSAGKTAAMDLGSKIGDAVKAGGRAAWDGLVSGMQAVSTAAQAAGTWLATVATAALEGAVNAGKAAVAWVAEKVAIIAAAVSEGAMTAAQWLLNVAMDANPIGLVVGALGLLVTAFILGWQNSQTFRNVVTAAFADTSDLVLLALKALVGGLKDGTDEILAMAYNTVRVLAMVPGPTQDSMKSAAASIKGFRDSVDQSFNGAIQKIDGWKASVDSMPAKVVLQGNIDDLTTKINDAKNQLSDRNLPPGKRATLTADITDWQQKLLSAKWELETEPDKRQAVLTAQISDWLNGIDQAKQALSDDNLPPGKRAELTAEISDLQAKVDTANAALASVRSKSVSITASFQSRFLDAGQQFADGGLVKRFADGGVLAAADGMTVPGYAPRRDSVLSLLSPGEGVLVPEAVRSLGGSPAITALNRSARSGAGISMGALTASLAPASGRGGGGGGSTVVVNVTVQGSVLSERDLRDVLEKQMYRLGMRGSTTWQPYQRR